MLSFGFLFFYRYNVDLIVEVNIVRNKRENFGGVGDRIIKVVVGGFCF